jgi:hypothetical protein
VFNPVKFNTAIATHEHHFPALIQCLTCTPQRFHTKKKIVGAQVLPKDPSPQVTPVVVVAAAAAAAVVVVNELHTS